MEKRTGETLYVCEKCGAYFLIEEACKMHERNCDGAWRGEAAAAELTEDLKRIRIKCGKRKRQNGTEERTDVFSLGIRMGRSKKEIPGGELCNL